MDPTRNALGLRRRIVVAVLAATLTMFGMAGPAAATVSARSLGTPAAASGSAAVSATTKVPSTNKHATPLCSLPKKKSMARCFAERRTDVASSKGVQRLAAGVSGYGPSDLVSAYGLPANGGAGQTVAIVDAFDDPSAEADLATYRAQFGLPPCTTANGCA